MFPGELKLCPAILASPAVSHGQCHSASLHGVLLELREMPLGMSGSHLYKEGFTAMLQTTFQSPVIFILFFASSAYGSETVTPSHSVLIWGSLGLCLKDGGSHWLHYP